MDELFPQIKKKIEYLIEDEEGNIPGNRLLTLGTLVVLLGILLGPDAFAAHRSHRSHSSHRSHRSSNTHRSHSSHANHSNHSSHYSHSSHESHSSVNVHSNHSSSATQTSPIIHSNDASESISHNVPSVEKPYVPPAYEVPGISVPPVSTYTEPFSLLEVNDVIEIPNSTPGSGLIPNIAAPSASAGTQFDSGSLETPPATETVK